MPRSARPPATSPAVPRPTSRTIRTCGSLRLEGFLVRNYGHLQDELQEFLASHLRSGRVLADQTVIEGFENVVDAFLGMLRGENTGKMTVRVSDPR
ncbi:NADPH-dependent curcumin reductase CurA [Kitasatospora sp. GP82]|nr:NADPH-dependent curcumin reductase CurA [Kitasatospora sp. GP82]